jgi:glycine/sarcosine N-methyltransferase
MGKIKGSFAETYDRFVKRQTLLPAGLLELVRELGGKSVLEFACGTGTVACGLALEGYDIVGVDYSPDMLKAARAKARRNKAKVKFITGDIAKVKIRQKFDLLLCMGNAIPHFKTQKSLSQLLENCKSHLNDGGHVVFQLLNYNRILKNRPSTFAIDVAPDAVRFKQYRYRAGEIDFFVTVVDGAAIPPTISKTKTTLKPWRMGDLKYLMARAGFEEIIAHGNYSKAEFNLESNDLIIVARYKQ